MIFKLSVLAVLAAPLVSALTVNAPSQPVTSGGPLTFTWTIANGDPSTFSVFLKNPSFNDVFGVANSIDATLQTLTITVPSVPVDQQYTIELVPIDNSQQVLAQSPPFNIGAPVTSAASTTTASASTHSVTSATAVTVSLSTPRPTPISTPTGFGTTVSAASSAASSATAPASSGSAASASSTPANSAALPIRFNMNMGVVASLALSVFAGAAVAL